MTQRDLPLWTIQISRHAERVLEKLPQDVAWRLDKRILALAQDPRPRGSKKLEGYSNLYRIRVGGWRVSYAVESDVLIILILEVAPRDRAYRF